jgi:hypothetical protein
MAAIDVYFVLLKTTDAPEAYAVHATNAGTPEQLTCAAAGRPDTRASRATLNSSLLDMDGASSFRLNEFFFIWRAAQYVTPGTDRERIAGQHYVLPLMPDQRFWVRWEPVPPSPEEIS